ncbi:hypothetical protein ACFB49_30370 [Sphingomonas sp. DBB INV C78]|uniref:nuclear transport factor 2 family protein n=1 Tax=Sphingomonas sp. DBB INV C78 TaxID=3349434 RepID=UPI0036D2FAF5
MTAIDQEFREIEQLLYRYAWMVDRREWFLMDEVFAPNGTIDYASTGGPGRLPYEDALTWLDKALSEYPINLHHITNISVDISGDTGKSRCYFTAPMGRKEPNGGSLFVTNAGYYFDELVRVNGAWRIAARFCDMTIQIGSLPAGHVIPPVD